jgi:hypothetical protein
MPIVKSGKSPRQHYQANLTPYFCIFKEHVTNFKTSGARLDVLPNQKSVDLLVAPVLFFINYGYPLHFYFDCRTKDRRSGASTASSVFNGTFLPLAVPIWDNIPFSTRVMHVLIFAYLLIAQSVHLPMHK